MKFAKAKYDAVVVGAGPNGMAAAIVLARAGRSVLLLEKSDKVGGGARTYELTLPGFKHDPCATIFGTALASPFFQSLPLDRFGLEYIYPPAPFAHPLDDEAAIIMERSVEETARGLGEDETAYRRFMTPLMKNAGRLLETFFAPYPNPFRSPLITARFGLTAIRSVQGAARALFKGARARSLFAGLGAHSILPLDMPAGAAFGVILGIVAHKTGWAVPSGGAQQFSDALSRYFCSLGGEIVTNYPVSSGADLPPASQIIYDLTPRQLLQVAGDRFSAGYRRQLQNFRYGPGVFKIDWALDAPIPWKDPSIGRAMVVHLGNTMEEIAVSERAAWEGRHAARPFVLLAQPSLFDPTRAPQGKHTAWAYCHVPHNSHIDMTAQIEDQVERYAPGFKQQILARSTYTAQEIEAYNPNYVGGDINGGIQDLRQMFTRPVPKRNPYQTSDKTIFICSSSTPPGGGVHGMCGYYAGQAALRAR